MRERANLRDERTFPLLAKCPEREVDYKFFDEVEGGLLKPKYHWCLLAEIVTAKEDGVYMKTTVKDKAGSVFPMTIYHPEGSAWVKRFMDDQAGPQYKVGNSVAVLYPHRQDYHGDIVGVHVEIRPWVLAIPKTMEGLLSLNDRIQQHHKKGEKMTCHTCGEKEKPEKPLSRCGGCNLFWYCDRDCLLVDRKDFDHKGDCRVLQDKNVQALFNFDWEVYKSSLGFSVTPMVKST